MAGEGQGDVANMIVIVRVGRADRTKEGKLSSFRMVVLKLEYASESPGRQVKTDCPSH